MLSKKIQKAKKLKALADRGYGSEKDSARKFYEEYLKKHNLTENDVEPKHHGRKIKLKDKDYEVLLSHIILSVNPFIVIDRKKGFYEVVLDDADYLEVMERTEFFYKAFNREKELLFVSFMDKFKNYFMTDEESVKKHSEVAKKMAEDAERLFKNQKTKEEVENEIYKSKTEKPLDKRKFQKIQYYKQLIDNLIYTKTNRRLQHENNNKNQTKQQKSCSNRNSYRQTSRKY